MEADWSVEIGPDTAVIDAQWPGLVDLVREPHRIAEIDEASRFPALAKALLQINKSPCKSQQATAEQPGAAQTLYTFCTTKCDLWCPEEWDPYEMEADSSNAQAAIACYIDFLLSGLSPTPEQSLTRLLFAAWPDAEETARALAVSLRNRPLSGSRAEFVVRSAVTAKHEGFAITAYLTACGNDETCASATLTAALEQLTLAIEGISWPAFRENPIPLQ